MWHCVYNTNIKSLDKHYKKAESLLLNALTLQKSLPDGYSKIDGLYRELGILYMNTNKCNQAEAIFKDQLNWCDKHNCGNPDFNNILINLTGLYIKKGDLKKADIYANEAMNKYNGKIFHKDVTTIGLLKNLAIVSYAKGDRTKAFKLLNEALKISIQISGENSANSIDLKNSIKKLKRNDYIIKTKYSVNIANHSI